MPELPEVETVRVGLSSLLPKKHIAGVSFDWPKSFPNAPADVEQFMIGSQVQSVTRRAKVLQIHLSSGYSLIIHLKMTGQLVYVSRSARGDERFGAGHPNQSLIGALPDRSTRVTIDFTDGSQLYFNDQRKFGWMKLLPSAHIESLDFFKKLGPEPLDPATKTEDFITQVRRRPRSTIKAGLLDQSVIAGVGNIYADESLWGASIHPATTINQLADKQLAVLFKQLQLILQAAIAAGGSTDKTYVDAEGKPGSYLKIARVFRREGQACPRCQASIEKMRVAGRGTHVCLQCQGAPR